MPATDSAELFQHVRRPRVGGATQRRGPPAGRLRDDLQGQRAALRGAAPLPSGRSGTQHRLEHHGSRAGALRTVHREERQRDVDLVVDVSPSMHAGFQQRTKLETAVELAATLAVSATDAGDRLGWVVFAEEVIAAQPAAPRQGTALASLASAARRHPALAAAGATVRRATCDSRPRELAGWTHGDLPDLGLRRP